MSNKKILLISEIFPPINGGSGRWFWELYSRLPKDSFCVLAGASANAPAFDQSHDMQVFRFDMSVSSWSHWGFASVAALKFYWRLYKQIAHLVKTQNITQIHCGRCIPEGVAAFLISKIYKIPYLCYIHGEDVTNAARSRELKWLVTRALRGSTQLICNSLNSQKILIEEWQCPESQTVVLNPGVDTKGFVAAEMNNAIRTELGWSDRPVILTVSRLEARKGHDVMIKAMAKIVTQHPNALYAIVGGGDRQSFLQQLIDVNL